MSKLGAGLSHAFGNSLCEPGHAGFVLGWDDALSG